MRQWKNLCLQLVVCIWMIGCNYTQDIRRSKLYSSVPNSVATQIDDLLAQDIEIQLLSIRYGPEWQTLEIYDRRLENGVLKCTVVKYISPNYSKQVDEVVLYQTNNVADLDRFRKMCEGIARVHDTPCKAKLASSNPAIRCHILLPQLHEVIIYEPWSLRGIEWLSENYVLLRDYVGDGDDSDRATVSKWVDVNSTINFDMKMDELEITSNNAVSATFMLEYYDLIQRAKYKTMKSK